MAKNKKKNKGIVLIKKANNLIESRYKFDIWETRFFLSVLSQIRRSDEEFEVYRIWYKDIIKTFGLKSGDSYTYLREAAKSLMGKSFFVTYEEEGVKREKQYHILREIDYLKEGQEGNSFKNHEYIDVTVEQKMRPLLLQLQRNFTAYDLRNVVKLSVYPIRVYELLKQYESIGKRTIEVDEMKIMFEVSEKYKLFGDFFRWVIKPAIKEINLHTDLTVTDIQKIKQGRSVVALRFVFHVKKANELKMARGEGIQQKLEFGLPHKLEEEIIEINTVEETEKDILFDKYQNDVVGRFGVTPSVFIKLLEKYNEQQLMQAIGVTNRAKYQNQIKTNVAGFFIKALKDGYTDEKEETKKKKLKQLQLQAEMERATKINERIKEVTSDQPEITKEAIAIVRKLESARLLIKQEEKKLNRVLVVEDFRQHPFLRELVKEKIIELSKDRFEDIF